MARAASSLRASRAGYTPLKALTNWETGQRTLMASLRRDRYFLSFSCKIGVGKPYATLDFSSSAPYISPVEAILGGSGRHCYDFYQSAVFARRA